MPQTGPKTIAGKHRSSLNSLTHGIHRDGFLPCKKEKCYFISQCPIRNSPGFSDIEYGSPCPHERAKYKVYKKMYAPLIKGDMQNRKLEELIRLLIIRDRQRLFTALHPDIIRKDNAIINRLSPGYRYYLELERKIYKIMEEVFSPNENYPTKE